MSAPTVTSVTAASPAARAGLAVGDELLSIDGQEPRDVIEFQRLSDASDLSVLVGAPARRCPGSCGSTRTPGEPLGVEVSSAVFDRIRTCDNHCAFCFIYQLPKGMRRSLYLKDDDYRLSFLYGNFTTLTRFTELDAERILTERLGPLFVSIHTHRSRAAGAMLRNPRGRPACAGCEVLLDGGIEVHGQIVVCPGVNDGAALETRWPGSSTSTRACPAWARCRSGSAATPTRPRCARTRPHEAEHVLDTIDEWQRLYKTALGHRMVFAADEYYLLAGRDLPSARSYDGLPPARERHRHGPGLRRVVRPPSGRTARAGCATGSSPRSTPRRPRATAPRGSPRCRPACRQPSRSTILTGTYGARVLAPLVASHPRRRRRVARRRQRVLRRQHRGGRPAHRRGPRPGARRTCPTARATSCPMPASTRAASSTG